MHGGDHRGRDEAAVGERQEVEPVVDDVEFTGPLEHRRDMEALGDLRSIVVSSDHPAGAVACRVAVVIESAVANSVTS